jgi:hypothetical protein
MPRPLAALALAVFLVGCSRYGTNPQGGPFSRKKPPPPPLRTTPVPGAAGSPLALPPATQPEPPPPPVAARVVPDRPVAPGGVVPAGAIEPVPPARDPRPGATPSPLPAAPPSPPPQPPAPLSPAASPAAPVASGLAEIKAVVQTAAGRWAKVDTYEATVTRRELTPRGEMNAEVLLYQFRREPMSLFTRNVGGAGKGREVVYNPAKYDDRLHVMLGEGDNRLMGAGFKAPPVSPDDARVKEKARYSIREAGFGTPIKRVAGWVEKAEAGKIPADALTFLGPVERPEYPYPLVGVSLKLRPGDDPMFPAGGVRQWYFDMKPDSPGFGMPVVILGHDAKGNEAEYYHFDKVRMPAGLTDADFDPARLGKKR